jgi:hypothetical protein
MSSILLNPFEELKFLFIKINPILLDGKSLKIFKVLVFKFLKKHKIECSDILLASLMTESSI